MNKIAQFEKVSYEQFQKDWKDCFPYCSDDYIKEIYKSIQLPKRATSGSAGYDFYAPEKIILHHAGMTIFEPAQEGILISTETIKFPTGIRCKIKEGWALQIYPRSSLGFKYGLQLANTVGIIDSDYYYSYNEGHIFVKLVNNSFGRQLVTIDEGQAICQGIFTPYGITCDDNTTKTRNGGFGSTDDKQQGVI